MDPREAFELALLTGRVSNRFAMEHDSPAALAKYLKTRPGADRSKHKVKKQQGKPTKRSPPSEVDTMRDMVKDPEGHGLDPEDDDDAKTIADYKKQVAKHDSEKSTSEKYEKLKRKQQHHRTDEESDFMKGETKKREDKADKEKKLRSGR